MVVEPNFVGIGAQKSATTWMSECLRSHPDIFLSSPKELRYFTDNRDKGWEWYLTFFEGTGDYQYRGEFSSNYIYSLDAARTIKEALGPVKIIAVVRDPVERTLSHIKHLIRDQDIPAMSGEISLDQLIGIADLHPSVVSNSFYSAGLQSYRDVFGASSLFVVNQSACMERGEEVLDAMWTFLGLDKISKGSQAKKIISAGINPRFHWLEALRKRIFVAAKYNAPWLISFVRRTGGASLYRKMNAGQDIFFAESASNYLNDLYQEDWRATKSFLYVEHSS